MSDKIIKDKKYDFKFFETTYATLYNKIKKLLNMNKNNKC